MTIKTGDVIFVRGNSLLSKLIRLFDKGEFSHVAIILDGNHVIGSQYPDGVQIRHFRFNDYELIRIPLDIEKAKEYIGYKYDYKQFFWYAFKVGKVWNTPNQFICSELIAYAMGDSGLTNKTPNELYKALSNMQ